MKLIRVLAVLSLVTTGSVVAQSEVEDPEGEVYSQLLVGALIGAADDLYLHDNVAQDFSDKKLRENIRIMVAHIKEKEASCQKELHVIKKMHVEDKMGADSRIPVASIQDFDTAGSISERLSDLLDRQRDMKSFIGMRNALGSHFNVFFTTRTDRDMCRNLFTEAYEGGANNPEHKKACAAFDSLRSCMIEMRHINYISEFMRQDVSERYYDGKLGPRESRFPPKYKRQ
jgi:hypothetical protein